MAPESLIRLKAFLVVLCVMALLEWLRPRRDGMMRLQRWPGNLGVVIIYSLLLVLIPITPLGAALESVYLKFGVFYWYPIPLWWAILISVLVLDMLIYWQHRLFHQIPMLWRLHRMHHSDQAIDVTTGFRFHPIEIILSVLIKAGAIMLLGAPLLAVLIFEVVLNCAAMFNHSNVKLPLALDKVIRTVLVTPDMHRVHHSSIRHEHDSNYSFNLSIWDRLFGSYVAQPAAGHLDMKIGLDNYPDVKDSRLDKLLLQPFK